MTPRSPSQGEGELGFPIGQGPASPGGPVPPPAPFATAGGREGAAGADVPVGPEVTTRDSILLTYFVDSGPLRFLRNRAKRIGNFIGNEIRSALRR